MPFLYHTPSFNKTCSENWFGQDVVFKLKASSEAIHKHYYVYVIYLYVCVCVCMFACMYIYQEQVITDCDQYSHIMTGAKQ